MIVDILRVLKAVNLVMAFRTGSTVWIAGVDIIIVRIAVDVVRLYIRCLLYTSDAADE